MATPRPGQKARGTRTGRPLLVLFDLLGRRGALRVLWELRAERLNFRALQDASAASPSVLNTRLTELRESGLVDHDGTGYGLTRAGASLLETLQPLHEWSERWAPHQR